MSSDSLQLALGPVLFYWTRERYADFYREAADWPVEIVTLGESVCSRRRDMKLDDWLGIGRELAQSGKQVVLASQTLIESEADLRDLRKLCDNGEFMVEANDQSALQRLTAAGLPFVAGAALNLYNPAAIGVMARAGMQRWQAPVEMSRDDLARLLTDCAAEGSNSPARCSPMATFRWPGHRAASPPGATRNPRTAASSCARSTRKAWRCAPRNPRRCSPSTASRRFPVPARTCATRSATWPRWVWP